LPITVVGRRALDDVLAVIDPAGQRPVRALVTCLSSLANR
jgi:hypothetical protein